MRFPVRLAFGLALVIAGSHCEAQGGPPMLTDDPGTTRFRGWEINTALTLDQRTGTRTFAAPLIDLNYGAGTHAQASLTVPWLVMQQQRPRAIAGIGGASAGLKYRLLDERGIQPDLAVYPQMGFTPISSSYSRGLVDRRTELFLPVVAAKHIGRVKLNVEAGYDVGDKSADQWVIGLAVGRRLSPRAELAIELFGVAGPGFAEQVWTVNAGARVRLAARQILLISVGRGLHPSRGDAELVAYVGIQTLR